MLLSWHHFNTLVITSVAFLLNPPPIPFLFFPLFEFEGFRCNSLPEHDVFSHHFWACTCLFAQPAAWPCCRYPGRSSHWPCSTWWGHACRAPEDPRGRRCHHSQSCVHQPARLHLSTEQKKQNRSGNYCAPPSAGCANILYIPCIPIRLYSAHDK